MSLARPRAKSLTILVPRTALWHLCRPPTPRRATYPLTTNCDTPSVPPLSFWDPETPFPLPTSSQPHQLLPNSPFSFSDSQSQHSPQLPHLARSLPSRRSPRLTLPLVLPQLLICSQPPLSPVSPRSPTNPFLSPPLPRFNPTAFFTLAAPLLPASPLSIFDRAVSPTSPAFLLNRTPSPGTPEWLQPTTFPETAAPSMVGRLVGDGEGKDWEKLSPTFLWPRTPPAVPRTFRADAKEQIAGTAEEEGKGLGITASVLDVEVDKGKAMDVERRKMRLEFYHFIATKRAASVDRLSSSTISTTSTSLTRRLAKPWRKLVPRMKVGDTRPVPKPSRRSRFNVRNNFGF